MTKVYLAMVLVLAVLVTATLAYIDIVIQEAHDHRWAVSNIASLVPDVDNSWRLRFFGHQYTLQPERIIEAFGTWINEQAYRVKTWFDEMYNSK